MKLEVRSSIGSDYEITERETCLLTGAASGIGRALALELARAGVHLYLLDIDAAGLKSVVDECRSLGVVAVGRQCDLSQPAQIAGAIADLLARWKYIDLLVNNAGVAYYGPTEKMTAAQWDWLMAINLLAPLQITRELLPTLLARGEVHILNVCSISGIVAGGRFSAYHTSKFGLVGFTEAMRAEYNRRGIGVTNLCPGPVSSNLYNRALSGRGKPVPNPPSWLCASPERCSPPRRARNQEEQANRAGNSAGPTAVLDQAYLAGFFGRFEPHQPQKTPAAARHQQR